MTRVEPWVVELTESVLGGPPVEVGQYYEHPEDGLVQVFAGQYWGLHGLSNWWGWRVHATGEIKYGYAGNWPVREEPHDDEQQR